MSRQDSELPYGWVCAKLGDVLEFKYGKSLPAIRREGSSYSVFGSNGIIGHHSEALVEGPVLIIGRKGSIGEIHQSDAPCWPIDTTYFVDDFHGQPVRFWYHQLKVLPLAELNRATALPGLNRSDSTLANQAANGKPGSNSSTASRGNGLNSASEAEFSTSRARQRCPRTKATQATQGGSAL